MKYNFLSLCVVFAIGMTGCQKSSMYCNDAFIQDSVKNKVKTSLAEVFGFESANVQLTSPKTIQSSDGSYSCEANILVKVTNMQYHLESNLVHSNKYRSQSDVKTIEQRLDNTHTQDSVQKGLDDTKEHTQSDVQKSTNSDDDKKITKK